EIVRRLRAIDPALPVVVLSGESELPEVLRAVHQGIFDFVHKDGDPAVFSGAVARAFAHGRVVRENARLTAELKTSNSELATTVDKLSQQSRDLEDALAAVRSAREQLIAQEQLASLGVL